MKLSLTTLLVVLSLSLSYGQGINFFHGTWEEALAEAQKQDKLIFVDAYAEWCGPCKRMAKLVFTDSGVGDFFNKNFINLKVDMEKPENMTFRKKYPVSAFPTLYFIDYTGEVVQQVRGAQQAEPFINLGKQALSKVDRSGMYAEAYENGDRDPELVYNYVKALNRAGKSSLKIANEYIRDQKDLDTEQNLRFLFIAANEADSRLFDLMVERRDKIAAMESEEAVREQIYNAVQATAQKAITYKSRDVLEVAQDKMKKHYPEKANEFTVKTEMEYSLAHHETKEYLQATKDYLKKVVDNDPQELFKVASTISNNFKEDDKAMKTAEAYAKEAAEEGNTYEYYFTYASILKQNGETEKSREAAEKCLELARAKGPAAVRMVQIFMEKI